MRNLLNKSISILLVLAHVALITPLPEAHAMESANFKINESVTSSGGGDNAGTGANIPYSNVAENNVGNAESAGYKVSLGYINTIASNPPVLHTNLPQIIEWNKGGSKENAFVLNDYFSSPDDSTITYEVEGNSQITVAIDPATHAASFSQGPDFFGSEAVRFIAIDSNKNRTKSNFVILAVKATTGNPPIIYPISDITVKENELVRVTPTTFDLDGNALTTTFTAPLDDSGTWQTTYNDAGTYKVTATVSDGALEARTTFNITVKNVNRPPVIDSIAPITVDEGSVVNLNVAAHDPDGDNVTISYPSPFDAGGAWQTTYKDAGQYHFTVTASDGDLSTARDVDVTVNPVNAAPRVSLYADKTSLSPSETFTIYLLAQDPDGDQLKLTLKKDGSVIAGCDNISLDGQTFTTTLSIASSGSHTITAVVTEANVPDAPNTVTSSLKINIDENSSSDEYFPISGDFNGDGLTDLGYYNRKLGIWKVELSKGDGTFGPVEYWISSGFGNDDSYYYPMTSDFNGDGKTDVGFIRIPTSVDGANASYIRLAISNATGFEVREGRWRESDNIKLRSYWKFTTFTGDFNGDGLSDIGQIHIDDSQQLWIGLTKDNLGTADEGNWYNGSTSSISSNFSPLAGDFNGDGLTDLCLFRKSEGRWVVILSNGNKFGDITDWLSSFGGDKDPVLGDFNSDGLTDIGYCYKENGYWQIKYAVSDGTKFIAVTDPYPTGASDNVAAVFITADFNGDGLFDIGIFDKGSHRWTVKLHHSKYPDLLVSIDNGIGGKTIVEYKDSVIYDNTGADGLPDLPFAIRVVDKVVQEDGLGGAYTTRYFYKGGYFEPGKREFRGFGHVKVIDSENSVKETEFYQDDIRKGRPKSELIKDKYNRLYSETRYKWHNSGTDNEPVYRKAWGGLVPFPTLEEKEAVAHNPHDPADFKSIRTSHNYDEYGNPVEVKEYGFTGAVLRKSVITYTAPNLTDWIIGKPAISTIYEGDGAAKVSETRYYYDNLALGEAPLKGGLTKEEKWLNLPAEKYIATQFGYDGYGNVEAVTDAKIHTTTTIYDTTKTFPESVRNHIGHTQSFTYDRATGKILTSTDPNNQVTTSEYDGFGRLKRVVGPGSISEATYTYDLDVRPARITTKENLGTVPEGDCPYFSAFTFVDGLGREIFSRVEAERGGAPKHIVSGMVKYDSRGQVIEKYLPFYADPYDPSLDPSDPLYSPIDPLLDPSNPLSATLYSTPKVSYTYDAMGRLTKTIRPDNKIAQTIYGIDTVEIINENGQHASQTKDAYGRIVEIEEDTGAITNYAYDTLGNLTDTYDSASPRNHTHMEYDSLGRKISMTDPDMGGFAGKSWRYCYDDVGNLISQVDAKDQTLVFEYDAINRLTKKQGLSPQGTVPVFSVDYTYDETAKSNCIGRLSRVTDSSGSTEFFYDILGREIRTDKEIFGARYQVQRSYDSLDRLVLVIYPDETEVKYEYNTQGGIVKIWNKIGTVPDGDCPHFVSNVDYNANGQIEEIHYGNGTSTTYSYDPYNFRMDHLETASGATAIQKLSYNFDPVGNVTSILDSVHTNTQVFQYDNLNRLTYANGASYGVLSYAYNSIGNLLQKGNLTMEYSGLAQGIAGPHAVTTVRGLSPQGTVPVSYDPNGNMTRKGDFSFEYDIENRLKKVIAPKGGDGFVSTFNFNAGWNFFSLAGFVPNTGGDVKTILQPIEGKFEQVSYYDPAVNGWKHYVGNPDFNQFDKFEYGRGYLIYMNEPCTLRIDGIMPSTKQSVSLKTGWNLIQAPTKSSISATDALKGVSYTALKEIDLTGEEIAYRDTDTLYQGEAYLIQVDHDQAWIPPLGKIATTYAYDGDGGRVMRQANKIGTVPEGDCPYFSTVYIGSSYELEGAPGRLPDKITKHIYMGSTRVCSIETTTATHTYYYHQDHIGSSNVITDETGEIAQILEYSPYGEVSRQTGNYSTDKRFTGKIYDDSSALLYFGARYYDPELGRFITADPTIAHPFDPQDLNRYSYCRNNPVNYIDPTGLSWWSDFWNWISDNWQGIVAIAMIVISVVVLIIAPYTAPYMVPTLIGQISGAVIGGMSAAESGGNIGSGMLFGVIAGTVTGGSLGGMAELGYGEFVLGQMAMGAVGGAGAGATSGYAGGQGDIEAIVKSAAIGAGTAAIIAGAMGVLQGHPLLPSTETQTQPVNLPTNKSSKTTAENAKASSPGTSATLDSTPGNAGEKAQQKIIDSLTTKPNPTPTISTESQKRAKALFIIESGIKRAREEKHFPIKPPGKGPPEYPTGWDSWLVLIGRLSGWW